MENNKRFFLPILFVFICMSVYSQIKMAQFPDETKASASKYDSLTNVRKIEYSYEHLVGQKITTVNLAENRAFIKYNGLNKLFQNEEKLKEIEGKDFLIIASVGNVFVLQEVNNPTHQFQLSVNSEYAWIADLSFVCHGYFEKIKELYLGKELVYVHKDDEIDISSSHSYDRFIDYSTKSNLRRKMPINSKWICTDVLVLPGKLSFGDCKDRVILNIENEQHGKFYIFASELLRLKEMKHENFMVLEDYNKHKTIQRKQRAAAKAKAEEAAKIAAEKEAERRSDIIQKYGSYYGNLIIQGKVVIGMTKQHCREALGEPRRINKTTTATSISEQWVYYGKYLYFENGELVTIQE